MKGYINDIAAVKTNLRLLIHNIAVVLIFFPNYRLYYSNA